MQTNAPPSLGRRIIGLPREIRDMIYSHAVAFPGPIPLQLPPIASPELSDPMVAAEAAEVFYQVNAFLLYFDHRFDVDLPSELGRSLIRQLHIQFTEVDLFYVKTSYPSPSRAETFCSQNPERAKWKTLLTFPRLERLTIWMQKEHHHHFEWMFFSPVLYALRERQSSNSACNIQIEFHVSFDDGLELEWEYWWKDHLSLWIPPTEDYHPYEKMGYIDVSDMIVSPPSDEDKEYVKVHLPHEMYVQDRNFRRGLLNESPAQRRQLGELYVVREPALLRVLMEKQYVEYKKLRGGFEVTSMEDLVRSTRGLSTDQPSSTEVLGNMDSVLERRNHDQ